MGNLQLIEEALGQLSDESDKISKERDQDFREYLQLADVALDEGDVELHKGLLWCFTHRYLPFRFKDGVYGMRAAVTWFSHREKDTGILSFLPKDVYVKCIDGKGFARIVGGQEFFTTMIEAVRVLATMWEG